MTSHDRTRSADVLLQVSGGTAQLTTDDTPRVWSNSGAKIGFSVRGHDYVAYAPTGATWNGQRRHDHVHAGRQELLHGRSAADERRQHRLTERLAGDLVRQVRACARHRNHGVVRLRPGHGRGVHDLQLHHHAAGRHGDRTVVSLYPHQWKALSGGKPITPTYVSPRGAMKTLVGVNQFTTAMKFHGLLPELPAVATSDRRRSGDVDQPPQRGGQRSGGRQKADTYWTGKGLGRAARIAEIADQSATPVRDKALAAMKKTMTDWFTASSGETDHLFYYDKNWGTLIGYDASYGSDQELNDHHFHYGYFIAAAATLARFDPAWARPDSTAEWSIC